MPDAAASHACKPDVEKTEQVEASPELIARTSRQTAAAEDGDPGGIVPGTIVGEYVTSELISSGGGGAVYRAHHLLEGRRAAVKVLRRELAGSRQMTRRFFLEALAVNLIKHPNIVEVYELGELGDGRPFYVMEYLEGQDLRQLIEREGPVSPPDALALLEPVCAALEAVHKAGYVHRDVKASNVHVGVGDDGRRIVKLLDFGVVKAPVTEDEEASFGPTGRLGTSASIAPEQIVGGDVGPATDVYALGVLLYRLITGVNPFAGEHPGELDRMHLEAPPPRPSALADVGEALDGVVLRAMAKRSSDRFASPTAFLDGLRAAVSGGQAGTT